jgi:hypothetical protein
MGARAGNVFEGFAKIQARLDVHRAEPSRFTRSSTLGVDESRVNVIIALTDPVPQGAVFECDSRAPFSGNCDETDVELSVSGVAAGAVLVVDPDDRVKEGARVEAR